MDSDPLIEWARDAHTMPRESDVVETVAAARDTTETAVRLEVGRQDERGFTVEGPI